MKRLVTIECDIHKRYFDDGIEFSVFLFALEKAFLFNKIFFVKVAKSNEALCNRTLYDVNLLINKEKNV